MKFLIQPLIDVIESRPILAYAVVGQGILSSLLVWLKMMTPIIGFASAVIGLAAATITLMIKLREWRAGKK